MNAIKAVFPNIMNLLCVWHINMNVRKQIQQTSNLQKDSEFSLVYDCWKKILYINTLPEYKTKWAAFKHMYQDYESLTDYIYWWWLKDYKEHFIQV